MSSGSRELPGSAASSLLPFQKLGAPCHLENQGSITQASCLRPHQACPIGFTSSCLASLWTHTNQRSTPLPTSGRMLLGVNTMTWPSTNPTLLTSFQSFRQSSSQAPPVPGKRKTTTTTNNKTGPWGPSKPSCKSEIFLIFHELKKTFPSFKNSKMSWSFFY